MGMSTEKVNEDEETGKNQKIDLDTILIEELGQFGRHQFYTIVLVGILLLFGASTVEFVFTAARVNSRCKIPECDGENPIFSPPWQAVAIPTLPNGAFDQCSRFPSRNTTSVLPADTCPDFLFDISRSEPCKEFLYENNYSVVATFDMGCDEWRRSLLGTIRSAAVMFALAFSGYISDRWGRRTAIVFNTLNSAVIGLSRAFVNSYEWFLALQVIESALGSGGFPSVFILLTELVGPKYRVAAGVITSSLFAIGSMFLGSVAWLFPQWRTMTLVIYIPQLLFVSYLWILPESIRWLLSKGRYEKAETILKQVAKRNKKELSAKSLMGFRATAYEEKKKLAENQMHESADEPWLVVQVIKSPVILARCCITPLWWITMTMVYYGLTINAVNLFGNQYLNYIVISAIELPGFWIAFLLLDRIGRKPVIIGGFWLCAACQFIFAFLPDGMELFALIVYMFGKCFISMVATSLYTYTSELYPTKYRNNLVSYSSTLGRIGLMTAPLTPALAQEVWEPLPSVLFGTLALVSGFLVFFTPETAKTTLPDTFEEAENNNKCKL